MALRCLNTNQQHKTNGFAALERRTRTKIPLYLSSGGCIPAEMRAMIWAAYRQVFSEHETLKFNRQITLETRLANGSLQSVTSSGTGEVRAVLRDGCFG